MSRKKNGKIVAEISKIKLKLKLFGRKDDGDGWGVMEVAGGQQMEYVRFTELFFFILAQKYS